MAEIHGRPIEKAYDDIWAENERLRNDLAALKARPDCAAPLLGLLHERDRCREALERVKDHSNDCGCGSYEIAQEALDG